MIGIVLLTSGSARTLEEAAPELSRLPAGNWESRIATTAIPSLRFVLGAKQDDPMMQPYKQIVDTWIAEQRAVWEQKGYEKGYKIGFETGLKMIMAEGVHPALMDSLLSHYKLRFSDPPAELAARLGAITDPADLRALLPLFARGSAEDIGHLLQGHDS